MGKETEKTGQELGQSSETVSIEKFNELNDKFTELTGMFEQVKKAQQGSDRKTQELQEELEKKNKELEEAKETANMDKVDLLAKQLKDMSDKMEASTKETAREKFLANGYKLASDLGVSTKLVDHYGGEKEGLEEFLKGIKEDWEAKETAIKNEYLANGYKPNNGGGGTLPAEWDYKKHTKEENLEHDKAEMEELYNKSTA